MQTNNTFRFALLAALTLLAGAAEAQSGYTITDLGNLGGASNANSINNSGQVVGVYYTPSTYRAFTYSNGQMTDLGNPGDSLHPTTTTTSARGINDSGQVVGLYSYSISNPNGISSGAGGGFLYQNGQIQAISLSRPYAINNAGQIVGEDSNNHAALYQNGVTTTLNLISDPNSSSDAYAINNSGVIVGDVITGGAGRAYYYQNGVEQLLPQLSPQLSGAIANGINDSNQIVGVVNFDNTYGHAALWQNGQITDLGSLYGRGSSAYDINSSGVIVGVDNLVNGSSTAFVYKNGHETDLLAGTGWHDGYATSINDSGQIVGFATSPLGYSHAFLATPNAVPAPGSLLTFGVGVGVLLLAARRRKSAEQNRASGCLKVRKLTDKTA